MPTHEITIQPDDWTERDPKEDRYVTVKWTRLDSLHCVACGSQSLYTQPWSPGLEFYLICIACGVELISKEIESARLPSQSWSHAFLSKLREREGVKDWKSSEHLEMLRPIFENGTPLPG